MTNEETIWRYLKNKGLNDYAVSGLMGNIKAESGFSPINLQDSFEKKLGFTDQTYCNAVDNGKYDNFINDSAGWGITQTTYCSRKKSMLDFARSNNKSIGDLYMQLDFLWNELNELFPSMLQKLKKSTSVKYASDLILIEFEMPADMSDSVKNLRAQYGQEIYDKYTSAQKGGEKVMAVTEKQAIQKLIDIAEGELGYLEKATNSQLDSKTANAGNNNYTKYWRDVYPSFQSLAWCACFVSWCFMKAFGQDTAKKLLKHWPYTYVPSITALFPRHSNPKVGDIVAFWRNGEFAHTGLVVAVNGDQFTTIEGNTSGGSTIIANGGGVCKKTYYNSNLPGTKFLSPDYSIVKNLPSSSEQPQPSQITSSALSETVKKWAKTTKKIKVYKYAGNTYGLCSFSPLSTGAIVGICDTLTGEDKKKWCFIKYGDLYGFVPQSALIEIKTGTAEGYDKTIAGIYVLKKKMYFRMTPNNSSSENIILTIPAKTQVQNWGYYGKESDGDKFLYIEYKGIKGFLRLSSKYLAKKKS